jgi:DUF4097 and DUF4098 domain-containing protein YvlB
MRHTAFIGFIAIALVAPVSAHAQRDGRSEQFHWKGKVAAGKTLEIQGVNGDIRAVAATGDEAEVSAVKTGRRSDPQDVEIKVLTGADGVTICAVYPSPSFRRANECVAGGSGHNNVQNNDVVVHWTIKVPAGVLFSGHTVNGDASAEGMRADADVHTVNGSVRVSTTGYAEASTVNGSVDATFGRADWSQPLRISTVNGGITLNLPPDLNAEVRAETVNGDIESDFPLTVAGRFNRHRISGVVGKGGRSLHLSTVNGDIRLLRGR